jgi:hypothetical protein
LIKTSGILVKNEGIVNVYVGGTVVLIVAADKQ